MESTNAKLSFVPSSGPLNHYFISYSEESNAERYGVQYDNSSKNGVITYDVHELKLNTKYYFKVRAGNGCMPGPWSNIMEVRTPRAGSTGTFIFYRYFKPEQSFRAPGSTILQRLNLVSIPTPTPVFVSSPTQSSETATQAPFQPLVPKTSPTVSQAQPRSPVQNLQASPVETSLWQRFKTWVRSFSD